MDPYTIPEMIIYESDGFRITLEDGSFYPEEYDEELEQFERLTSPSGKVIACDTLSDATYYELGDF
jgi:hypothetical protein